MYVKNQQNNFFILYETKLNLTKKQGTNILKCLSVQI